MLWRCPGHVLMVSRSCCDGCPGPFLMAGRIVTVSWSCFGGVPVMFWWCPGHVTVSRSCCDGVLVILSWFSHHVMLVSRWPCDGVPVMLWWCPNHVVTVSRSCFDGALVILWWCPGYVMMVSKEEMVDNLKTAAFPDLCFWSLWKHDRYGMRNLTCLASNRSKCSTQIENKETLLSHLRSLSWMLNRAPFGDSSRCGSRRSRPKAAGATNQAWGSKLTPVVARAAST